MFSLECGCMKNADNLRLDVFPAKCLRKVLGIPHSMFSHITNEEVRTQAGVLPIHTTLLKRQLCQYGRISFLPNDHPLRESIFDSDSVVPKVFTFKRRRGRPRMSWPSVIYAKLVSIFGDEVWPNSYLLWRSKVLAYFSLL